MSGGRDDPSLTSCSSPSWTNRRPHVMTWPGRGDPGDTLLHQLRALTPGIKPLSHCRVTARDGVIGRATGSRGVILQVARLTMVHAAAVDVIGEYYITHRHAASFRYHVTRDGCQWAVATAHLLWRA